MVDSDTKAMAQLWHNVKKEGLLEIIRIVKFMETEGRMVVPRGWGAGRIRTLLFSGHRVSACKRKCSGDWLQLQNNGNVSNALELYIGKWLQ